MTVGIRLCYRKRMFKHDLKIAWRNLLKYKQQTVISLLGLAVGLTSFVLCNDQLRDELIVESGECRM